MHRLLVILIFSISHVLPGWSQDTLTQKISDTLLISGQLSTWTNYNHQNDLPLWLGARYIPQANYNLRLADEKLIDFEVSANINGSTGFHFFDSSYADGNVRPYRAWVRYSTNQFELRAGLQKINFGSASILRPLMWFELVDPRDPLRITTGVWGLLGRYYFLNNANIWLWGLYGNDDPKTWEVGKTSQRYPEFGGRFQIPILKGEGGISFHHRLVDTRNLEGSVPGFPDIKENRIAIDGKWDVGVGLWFEGAWIKKNKDVGILTNQLVLNGGTDYTFNVGNGLNVIFEQLLISYDRSPFDLSEPLFFSALSLSYPIGLFDNLSAMLYYNWANHDSYNLVNWKKQIGKFDLYFLAYWNPDHYSLPQQQDAGNLFSGKGIQIMAVFNH
ncbi:MAG: hypothetical protein WD824_04875 [Cyclobacteriaceae bacterium]